MKITEDMVVQLNTEIAMMGCPFRYNFMNEGHAAINPHIQLVLASMTNVLCFTVYPTDEFIKWLYSWFALRGVELSCNNDRSIFWSKNGWDEFKQGREWCDK